MSQLALQEVRPPFVQFEVRPVEDRAASEAAGCYVARDEHFAIITPAGSRDRYEFIVHEWLARMQREVKQDRVPGAWYDHYKAKYEAWKKGNDIDIDGTPLKTWPPISPAQLASVTGLGILSVEALAEAPEEAIMRLGMGGRALVNRAQAWIKSRAGEAQKIAELQRQVAELTAKLNPAQTPVAKG
jgi:hypothetical protein